MINDLIYKVVGYPSNPTVTTALNNTKLDRAFHAKFHKQVEQNLQNRRDRGFPYIRIFKNQLTTLDHHIDNLSSQINQSIKNYISLFQVCTTVCLVTVLYFPIPSFPLAFGFFMLTFRPYLYLSEKEKELCNKIAEKIYSQEPFTPPTITFPDPPLDPALIWKLARKFDEASVRRLSYPFEPLRSPPYFEFKEPDLPKRPPFYSVSPIFV